jgi:hypothetical protein
MIISCDYHVNGVFVTPHNSDGLDYPKANAPFLMNIRQKKVKPLQIRMLLRVYYGDYFTVLTFNSSCSYYECGVRCVRAARALLPRAVTGKPQIAQFEAVSSARAPQAPAHCQHVKGEVRRPG